MRSPAFSQRELLINHKLVIFVCLFCCLFLQGTHKHNIYASETREIPSNLPVFVDEKASERIRIESGESSESNNIVWKEAGLISAVDSFNMAAPAIDQRQTKRTKKRQKQKRNLPRLDSLLPVCHAAHALSDNTQSQLKSKRERDRNGEDTEPLPLLLLLLLLPLWVSSQFIESVNQRP